MESPTFFSIYGTLKLLILAFTCLNYFNPLFFSIIVCICILIVLLKPLFNILISYLITSCNNLVGTLLIIYNLLEDLYGVLVFYLD